MAELATRTRPEFWPGVDPASSVCALPVTVVADARVSGVVVGHLRSACEAGGRPFVLIRPGLAGPPGLVVDLSGRHRGRPGQEVWRLRAGAGPLDGRFALSAVWHRPPHRLAVVLTTSRGNPERDEAEEVLGLAHIGSDSSRHALLEKVGATAAHLLTRALRGENLTDGAGAAPPPVRGRDGLAALARGWLSRQAALWRGRLFAEWWTIGISEQSVEDILLHGRLGPVTWLRPEPGQAYWADPFAWPGTGRILCEEYPVEGGPGVIAVLCQDGPRGRWRRERVLLSDRLHRSYPCTYAEADTVHLIPECIGRGDTVLYRLDAAGGIVPVAEVARMALADPTLFRHGGRYWVAGTDLAIGAHDNLCLFHAERLEGPWRPHAANPVKLDISGARSAGTPFEHDGRLFRPAQDCAGAYGAGILLHEVTTLTPEAFREMLAVHLVPDRRGVMSDGLHTLSAAGSRTLVDGKRMVLAPDLAARRLARRIRARWRRWSGRAA